MSPAVSGTFDDDTRDWQTWLHARPLAVFMTIGADGDVHATPVEVVVRDGRAHVWVRSDSVKARNALRAGRASLMAYKSMVGVLLRGPVRALRDGDDDYEVLTRAFLDKYDREETFGNDVVFALDPERVVGWT